MQSISTPRILCIDDYSASSNLIDMLLYIKRCEYDFSTANTPTRALKLLAAQKFDLYILEYELPEMNGFQLCRKIRQMDGQTPILFFTGTAPKCDRETAFTAGATEYLVKPANLEQITLTIRRLLGEIDLNATTLAQSTSNFTATRF